MSPEFPQTRIEPQTRAEPRIYGDSVVTVNYALVLMVAVVCFAGACFSLYAYLPDLKQHGLTLKVLQQTPALTLFVISMLLALPTTILLLCRCIWSASEVTFFAWAVVLVGGIMSYAYIVLGMNLITRNLAELLSGWFYANI